AAPARNDRDDAAPRIAARHAIARLVRQQRQYLLPVGERVAVGLGALVDLGPALVDVGVGGLELERLGVVGEGVGRHAVLGEDLAELGQRRCALGVGDALPGGDGLGLVAALEVLLAESDQVAGLVGLEAGQALERGQRQVVLAPAHVQVGD